jgi:hypothetical protein
MNQQNRSELPVRIGETVGVDINSVCGWERFAHNVGERLVLYLPGQTLIVRKEAVGESAYLKLHRILLDRFHLKDLEEISQLMEDDS